MKAGPVVKVLCVSGIAILTACANDGFQSLKAQPVFDCLSEGGSTAKACTELSFGNVAIGSSATLQILLANTGRSTLTITGSGWTSDSDAALTDDFTITRVPPGSSKPFTISFHPAEPGSSSGTFFVTSVNSTQPRVELKVTGAGIGAAQPTLDQTSVDFGNVLQKTTVSKTLQLSNAGNVPFAVGSTSIVGPGVFATDLPSHTTIDAGARSVST